MVTTDFIESKNEELGENIVSQAADEFKVLEINLRQQAKKIPYHFLYLLLVANHKHCKICQIF